MQEYKNKINTKVQTQKYKYKNTNTKIQIQKFKYKNTRSLLNIQTSALGSSTHLKNTKYKYKTFENDVD